MSWFLSLRPPSFLRPLCRDRLTADPLPREGSATYRPLLGPVPFTHQVLADLYAPPTQEVYICLHLLRPILSSSPSSSASNPTQQEKQPQIPDVRRLWPAHSLLGAMVFMEGHAGIGEVGPRGHWFI